MWSSDYWNVKASRSNGYSFTEPRVRHDVPGACVEHSGAPGSHVDVYRYLYRKGERMRTEGEQVTFNAADTVYCRPGPPE